MHGLHFYLGSEKTLKESSVLSSSVQDKKKLLPSSFSSNPFIVSQRLLPVAGVIMLVCVV
jgi:hypothetical protein